MEKSLDQSLAVKQDKHGNTMFNVIAPVGRPVTMLADQAAELNTHTDNTLLRYELVEKPKTKKPE